MIVQKGIECPACHEQLYSNTLHDLVVCRCGDVFIDGGFEYKRVGYRNDIPIDISRSLDKKPTKRFRSVR